MQNYLETYLSFPAAVANQVVNVHGYSSGDELAEATVQEMRSMIAAIRRTPSDEDDPASPKIVVGQLFATRIEHLTHYARYLKKVQRAHTVALGTPANVSAIGRYYEQNGEHLEKDLPSFPPPFDNKNSRSLLEY